MAHLPITPDICFAAGRDAANRQMRSAGRSKWSRADARLACVTVNRLTLKHGDFLQRMAAADCLRRMGERVARPRVICPGRKSIHGIPAKRLAPIYSDAAAWLERNPVESASRAIHHASSLRSFKTQTVASHTFRDSFGCWIGNGAGVLMLCFASALAAAGDL